MDKPLCILLGFVGPMLPLVSIQEQSSKVGTHSRLFFSSLHTSSLFYSIDWHNFKCWPYLFSCLVS